MTVSVISVPSTTPDGRRFEAVEPIIKTLQAVLVSPYLDDSKPLSLLLLSDAGSGKSEISMTTRNVPGVVYYPPSSTGAGILKDLVKRTDRREKINFILMDDLIPTLSRSKQIQSAFLGIMLNVIDCGMGKPQSFDFKDLPDLPESIRVGMIGGMTRQFLFKKYGKYVWDSEGKRSRWIGDEEERIKKEFLNNGWLERFIVLSFKYSLATVEKIITGFAKTFAPEFYDVYASDTRYHVTISEDFVRSANEVTKALNGPTDSNGIRHTRDFVKLLKCFALLRVFKAKTQDSEPIAVNDSDVAELLSVACYLNFEFNELRSV